MKNISLFSLILLLSFGAAKSQDYTPLLDTVNQWHVTYCYFGCNTDVYYTDGDTIVNGKNHKILDGYHYISRTLLLREEVEDKKVYFTRIVSPTEILEYLIYDFSKQEGDTLQMMNPLSPFPEDGGYFLLDSIVNRQLVDGEEYRHYYFTPTVSNTISSNNAVWVEGLGSLSIINAPGGDPDINGVGHVSCFFKNDDLFYTNLDSITGCEPVLHVGDVKRPLTAVFAVYDNEELITLHNTSAVQEITLYSLTGKFIDSKIYHNKEQIELSVKNLRSGIYLLHMTNTKGAKRLLRVYIK